VAAAGPIFFSLSVGFGVIINYASYVKPKDDIALSGVTASSINEFFEVCLGGLITLPAAFVFLGATTITSFVGSSFGLGFAAMPNVFAAMPGGQIFGFLWFFMLFLAAITSSLSMLQPVNAFFKEGLGFDRIQSTGLLFGISLIGTGFVVYFSKDSKALDTIDFWAGTFFIVVLALIQAIIYGWVLGIEKGQKELDTGAKFRVPRFVQFIIRYVTPTYIFIILVAFLVVPTGKDKPSAFMERIYEMGTNRVALGGVIVILGSLLMLWIMIYFAGKRWEAEGRYKNLGNDS
jgi:SNF family Na+-dependent transporter